MSKINYRRGESRRTAGHTRKHSLPVWTWYKRHSHRLSRLRVKEILHRDVYGFPRERDSLKLPAHLVHDWWGYD